MNKPRISPSLVFGMVLSLPLSAHAATVTEFFAGYGSTSAGLAPGTDPGGTDTVNSPGFGAAGNGWAGGWSGNQGPNYISNTSFSYSDPNYSNAGNGGVGIAGWGGNGGSGSVAERSFSTALTGTVWVSFLTRFANTTGESFLYLDRGQNDSIYFGAVAQNPTIRFGSGAGDILTGSSTLAVDQVHLLLARIVIDSVDANDSIDLWVNPNLASGVAGLGAANVASSGVDSVGTGLGAIGVGFRRDQTNLDAIRFSNDADGFAQVTSVPEPSAAILALLGLGILSRRKR